MKSTGSSPILIAGVGASAGGLEALKAFFHALPGPTGIGFVVIQHLEPTHESHMAELLAMHTSLKVRPAEDNLPIEADCIYTNPAHKYLECRGGVLKFAEPVKEHGLRLPIDFFLTSLAGDRGEGSAGIILSGSGSDGVRGVRAIRGAGGLTVAQSPQEAQFSAMPEHAIQAGLVDVILPVKDIPGKLIAFSNKMRTLSESGKEETADGASESLEKIVSLLHEQRGFNFSAYKRGTLLRRIERRMGLNQVASMRDYLRIIGGDVTEADRLVKDLMVAVTRFFRDPESFEALGEKAIAAIVNGKNAFVPIRVWVPGCSTGEEAYSLAILIAERTPPGAAIPIQIFATDIDKEALDFARAGAFPASIVADVSGERLERFFTQQGDFYIVKRALRECIVFASHDLLSNAPFSRLDLVSCRNVLIYLTPDAQRKVLSLFALALNSAGYLFLGSADSATHEEPFFEEISRKHGLYRRTMTQAKPSFLYPVGKALAHTELTFAAQRQKIDFPDLGQRALVKRFAACILLVDMSGQILHIQGPASKYLDFPSGKPSLNLFTLAPEALSAKLRAAFEKSLNTGQDVDLPRVNALWSDSPRAIHVTVMPVADDRNGAGVMAVIFTDAIRLSRGKDGARVPSPDEVSETARLKEELKSTREDLQAVISRLESANADLTAANEEVVSMNEELQSTVEELETAKEEGLSVNEELTTVNTELRERGEELKVAYGDLTNLFNATTTITLLLDHDLRLRRFTKNASTLFHVDGSDVGKPLSQIANELDVENLEHAASGVIQGLLPLEKEIRTQSGTWYTLRILPYRTLEGRVEGAVVTLSDVSRLKHAEQFAESIVETVREPLLVIDAEMRIVSANVAFRSAFQIQAEDIKSTEFFGLGNQDWDSRALREALEKTVRGSSEIRDFLVTGMLPGPAERKLLLNARRITGDASRPVMILIAIEDITDKLLAEETRRNAAIQITETETQTRERDRFSQVLHDQLQQLIVAAKMAVEEAASTVAREERETLSRAASHLAQALSASRSLTVELAPPAQLSRGLSHALEWLAHELQERYGLALRLDVDAAAEPESDAVKAFLFRSIREFLFNVVKHSTVKRAGLRLSLKNGRIAVRVSDEGKGIDAADMAGINKGETGFGLASIRERTAMFGGRLDITSRPGAGTEIALTIPADAGVFKNGADAAPKNGTSTEADRPESRGSAGSPEVIRVLVVDDHSIFRQGIVKILKETRDIRVIGEAGDGREGVELARKLHPDVVIMDLFMPNMKGDEATRLIVSEFPHMKVIALSMHEENEITTRMIKAGSVVYLTKGGPPGDLVDAIRKCGKRG